jgi:hypothetical protein
LSWKLSGPPACQAKFSYLPFSMPYRFSLMQLKQSHLPERLTAI